MRICLRFVVFSLLFLSSALNSCNTAVTRKNELSLPVQIAQDSVSGRKSFYEMHLGLFVHYMFPQAGYASATEWADGSRVQSLDELADNFDAADFAEKAHAMRAQFIVFTTSHANMNVLFPSAVINKYLPGHAAKRDVLRDVINEMKSRNIRIMFYIHPSDGHDFSKADQERVGWNDGEPYRRYNDFLNEYYAELAERYGIEVSGYFIDGGLPNEHVDGSRMRKTILSHQPGAWLLQNSGLDSSTVDFAGFESLDRPFPAANWTVFKPVTGNWWAEKNYVIFPAELAYRYTVLQASVRDRQGGGVAWSFGPYPKGRWEPGIENFCETLGRLMDRSGNSIFGTRPSTAFVTLDKQPLIGLKYVATESADGKQTYLHYFLPARGRSIRLPPPANKSVFHKAYLLANQDPLKLRLSAQGIELTLGEGDDWDEVDTIIVLE
jgi:hypothetical protein